MRQSGLNTEAKIKVSKLPGKENPADLGTKYFGRTDIERIWKQCGFYQAEGSSKIALKAAIKETVGELWYKGFHNIKERFELAIQSTKLLLETNSERINKRRDWSGP